ncbi:hypothetical protein PAF17_02300 [Paracoccus sp. Z330]|uniref:BPL/LPL catalytic domain-containing protein n=1 Tax=Paracoccus onchidii TaxID=3017813 RepID=A0ABT4ZAP8_9RHOB|nr:hypothetical protein [Paracoccus onchidii]MDB6176330.1 hypothetical protein [Paracoccus onchidii]
MTCLEVASAAEGIAREESLFSASRPAAFLWRAQQCSIVVPRARATRPGFDKVARRAAQAGWPILMRSTGGGAVPQGPGTLNLAIVAAMPAGAHIQDGYDLICGAISEALRRFDVMTDTGAVDAAFCDGDWNLVAGGLKLAGTAQRWRPIDRGASIALVHAAILSDPPPRSAWPVLRTVETLAGAITPPRRDVHVSLTDLLSDAVNPANLHGALLRAAKDRLQRITQLSPAAAPTHRSGNRHSRAVASA